MAQTHRKALRSHPLVQSTKRANGKLPFQAYDTASQSSLPGGPKQQHALEPFQTIRDYIVCPQQRIFMPHHQVKDPATTPKPDSCVMFSLLDQHWRVGQWIERSFLCGHEVAESRQSV